MNTEFQDRTLTCTECGAEFTFTAGEQNFYFEKGFQFEPRRCRACRQARKEGYLIVCEVCGQKARVPKSDMTICAACYKKSKGEEN